MNDKQSAVFAVKQSWNDGYRLIAHWFNLAFERHGIAIRIKSEPPSANVSFKECRTRLSNSLLGIRQLCSELPSDGELFPWIVGYLGSWPDDATTNVVLRQDNIDAIGGDVEGRLFAVGLTRWTDSFDNPKNIDIAVARKKEWPDAHWQTYVVGPMKENFDDWNAWFGRILDGAPLPPIIELTPLREKCGKRNRELMNRKIRPDERLAILGAEFPELELDKKSLATIQRTDTNRANNFKAKQRNTKTS